MCVEGRMGRAGECQEAACLGKEPRGLEQSSRLPSLSELLVCVNEAPDSTPGLRWLSKALHPVGNIYPEDSPVPL